MKFGVAERRQRCVGILVIFPVGKERVEDGDNEHPAECTLELVSHEEELERHRLTVKSSGDQCIVVSTH